MRTVELYRWLLRRHIAPTFGDMPLGAMTPAAVRLWHAGIAREHPTTAAKAYRLLSSIMRTAVIDELIAKSPCQVRGAAVERAPERPIATMAEVEELAAAMPDAAARSPSIWRPGASCAAARSVGCAGRTSTSPPAPCR